MIKIVKIQKEGTLEHTRASVCVRACAFGGEQGLMSAPWRLLWGSEMMKAAEGRSGQAPRGQVVLLRAQCEVLVHKSPGPPTPRPSLVKWGHCRL